MLCAPSVLFIAVDSVGGRGDKFSPVKTILLARLRCSLYLLFAGLWRGECALEAAKNSDGRVLLLACCRGSRSARSLRVTRIFYNPGAMGSYEIEHWLNGWSGSPGG